MFGVYGWKKFLLEKQSSSSIWMVLHVLAQRGHIFDAFTAVPHLTIFNNKHSEVRASSQVALTLLFSSYVCAGVMVSYSHYCQPLMDLFVTLLATLLQPIKYAFVYWIGREC